MVSEHNEGTVRISAGGHEAAAETRSSGVVVTVVSGPDAGATFRIEDIAHRRVLLGQSPACDVRLTDRSVSRRHAALELDGQKLRVLDLGSKNGTVMAGLEVKEVCFRPGTELTLGHTVLRVDLDGGSHVIPTSTASHWHRVLGASPSMRRLYPLMERLVGRDTHVLLEGEAGTGKELVAESIHDAAKTEGSPEAPFIVFEPAASRPESIEGDLFGEGATPGLLEQAHGGALFIDEIGDLPQNVQVKLLRVLERRETRRGGTGQPTSAISVRVFASTRRNLDADVQNRRFRDDLYLALAGVRIDLPPLRKRDGDVAFLTQSFWTALGGRPHDLPPSVVQRFTEHDWPGNVRELYFATSRVLASGETNLGSGGPMSAAPRSSGDFLDELLQQDLALPLARDQVIAEFERRYMERMLALHGGHVGRAAAASGIGRRYFQKLRAKK
jgi:DNA-binding NtrC family response regulator